MITIQKVTEVAPVEGNDMAELVSVGPYKFECDAGEFGKDYLLLLNDAIGEVYPLILLNQVYAEEEMVIGITSENGGKQMQLGPYNDALKISVGVDVTHLFTGSNEYLLSEEQF